MTADRNDRDTAQVRLPRWVIALVLKHEMTIWEKEHRQGDPPAKYVTRYLKKMLAVVVDDEDEEQGMTVQDMLKR